METLYLSCHGTAIYSFLEEMKKNDKKITSITKWICFGTSCLPALLKILGYTYGEIFSLISEKNMEYLNTLVPGFSVSERNQREGKKLMISSVEAAKKGSRVCQASEITNLQSLFKVTKYNLQIVVWDQKKSKPFLISKDTFRGSIADAIVIGLCSSSYLREYEMGENVFSSCASIVHPLFFSPSQKEGEESILNLQSSSRSKTLFIIPKYTIETHSSEEEETVFYNTELSLMKEFLNFTNHHNELFFSLGGPQENVILYESPVFKGRLTTKMRSDLCPSIS